MYREGKSLKDGPFADAICRGGDAVERLASRGIAGAGDNGFAAGCEARLRLAGGAI